MSTENEQATARADAGMQHTLRDGRVVQLREPTGGDLEKGSIAAVNPSSPISLMMAVVGQVATIDGRPLIYEKVRDLPMSDAVVLMGLIQGNGPAPSFNLGISSDSDA